MDVGRDMGSLDSLDVQETGRVHEREGRVSDN